MRRLLGILILVAALCASPASAAITARGDLSPTSDPSTWTSSTTPYIGDTSTGSVTVNGGSALALAIAYLGYDSTAAGTVTVDGAGSTWHNAYLYAGYFGTGALNITNGGAASSTSVWLGRENGSTGTATVDGLGSTWNTGDALLVGALGAGTLNVTNGGAVSSSACWMGVGSGSAGVVSVDGAGSTWNSGGINVGSLGPATLNISNGGTVSAGFVSVGGNTTSPCAVNFGANGGTLTTAMLYASPMQLAGTGTINTQGLVSDLNLVFASTSALRQTFVLNSLPGQDITLHVDIPQGVNNSALGAGYQGTGSLVIENGCTVASNGACLGYNSGSTGTATVSGAGSTWTSSQVQVGCYGTGTLNVVNGGTVYESSTVPFEVGYSGPGTLNVTGGTVNVNQSAPFCVGYGGSGRLYVTGGGTVDSGQGFIGYNSGSAGAVTVDGAGSTWGISGNLAVGSNIASSLSISGGAAVTANGLSINSAASLVAIDVGRGSSLALGFGHGTISNSGTVRVLAGAAVPAGNTYSPISAATWSGSGTYQAVGGTWNATSHQFIVSATQAGTAGTPVVVDLSQEQRMFVTDSATGATIGASFLAATSSTPITFNGSLPGGSLLTSLTGLLPPGDSVMSGWTCSTTGYASGNPAYFSLAGVGNGGGFYPSGLEVWTSSGSTWSPFSADDLTYDGTFASFTVTSFGSFAVTGVAVMPGDANRDGSVDINDLTIVLTNFGQTGMGWSQGTMDGDPTGTVDINDLTLVLTNFGQTAGSSAASRAAVPEPSALVLIGLGVVSLVACTWRRRG